MCIHSEWVALLDFWLCLDHFSSSWFTPPAFFIIQRFILISIVKTAVISTSILLWGSHVGEIYYTTIQFVIILSSCLSNAVSTVVYCFCSVRTHWWVLFSVMSSMNQILNKEKNLFWSRNLRYSFQEFRSDQTSKNQWPIYWHMMMHHFFFSWSHFIKYFDSKTSNFGRRFKSHE